MPPDVANPCLPYGLLLLAVSGLACSSGARASESTEWTPADSNTSLHETRIVSPPATGTLKTEATEVSGEPVGIACVTCHGAANGSQNSFAGRVLATKKATDARTVHTRLVLVHGNLQCSSCHEPESPNLLHTSAGENFSLEQSMRLCSQCHGLIRTAYDHGAHGGMRGYWDLQRGPRERNDCIVCHDPHSPAHPQIVPVAGPKDKRVFRKEHKGSMIDQRFGKDRHE